MWSLAHETYHVTLRPVFEFVTWRALFIHLHLPDSALEPVLESLHSTIRMAMLPLFPLSRWFPDEVDLDAPEFVGFVQAKGVIEALYIDDWPDDVPQVPFSDILDKYLNVVPKLGFQSISTVMCEALSGAEVNAVVDAMPLAYALDAEGPTRETTSTEWAPVTAAPARGATRILQSHRILRYAELGPAALRRGSDGLPCVHLAHVALSEPHYLNRNVLRYLTCLTGPCQNNVIPSLYLKTRMGRLRPGFSGGTRRQL